ncbi:MAG: hypothetical protein RhofKO_31870 [Rhodothermales bacterium]
MKGAAPLRQAFGDAVRERRQACGLSQEQLADGAVIDVTTVSRVERGDHNVKLETIARLAAGLGTSVSALMHTMERHL